MNFKRQADNSQIKRSRKLFLSSLFLLQTWLNTWHVCKRRQQLPWSHAFPVIKLHLICWLKNPRVGNDMLRLWFSPAEQFEIYIQLVSQFTVNICVSMFWISSCQQTEQAKDQSYKTKRLHRQTHSALFLQHLIIYAASLWISQHVQTGISDATIKANTVHVHIHL